MSRQAKRGPVRVETSVVTAPDGATGVLLQLPDGYVVMTPDDADSLAKDLVELATEARK